MYHRVHVMIGGQSVWFCSFFLGCGSWGLKSSCKAWLRTPFLIESSHRLHQLTLTHGLQSRISFIYLLPGRITQQALVTELTHRTSTWHSANFNLIPRHIFPTRLEYFWWWTLRQRYTEQLFIATFKLILFFLSWVGVERRCVCGSLEEWRRKLWSGCTVWENNLFQWKKIHSGFQIFKCLSWS